MTIRGGNHYLYENLFHSHSGTMLLLYFKLYSIYDGICSKASDISFHQLSSCMFNSLTLQLNNDLSYLPLLRIEKNIRNDKAQFSFFLFIIPHFFILNSFLDIIRKYHVWTYRYILSYEGIFGNNRSYTYFCALTITHSPFL